MSDKLKGTNLSSPIVPFTVDDIYPTHYSKYGNGGYMSVQTLNELEGIPQLRREEGMLVYCIQNQTFYQLENGEWVNSKAGGINPEQLGTQIYDENKIQELRDAGLLPEDYISIPSLPNLEYPNVNNTYLNIIFSSLRALQIEVAKMKNTFQYGMYSYVNRETAMSSVVNGYSDVDDTEPLWSVEEDDCSLSIVTGATIPINDNHTLVPIENVESANGILSINNIGAAWHDSEEDGYKSCPDTKIYLYLTTSDTNIRLTLTNCDEPSDSFVIDFNNLGIIKSLSEKYNIMVCVSRAVINDDETNVYVGKNYVWISVANYGTGETTNSGFWKNNVLYPNTTIIGNTEQLSDFRYYISSVEFRNENLYKFNGYSQYQNFSEGVGTEVPDDTDYKYRVAHITIRSEENLDMLNSIKNQLPTNELIYNEADGTLWIKLSNGNVRQISGKGTDTHSGMEQSEIIEWLAQNGIYVTESGSENIRIDNLAEITFIHQGTGRTFRFAPDSDGNLVSTEIPSESLQDRMNQVGFQLGTENTPVNKRGFVGSLGYAELHAVTPSITETSDIRLYADRVKIGAIYAPYSAEQTVFGCSHGYVELENTSDKDFQLDGCYLHFATGICTTESTGTDVVNVYTLPLEGAIPAGGTFLVRCKKYTDDKQANTFVKVDSFDMEWFHNGNLLDLTLSQNNTFMLTFGLPESFSISTVMVSSDKTYDNDKFPWYYHPRYIDSVSIGAKVTSKGGNTWSATAMKWFTKGAVADSPIDCIYKNTFELDPAKQAYQSLTGADSSRKRNENTQDYQYVLLTNENIEFPKTVDTIPVSVYTPKASYQHKNVSTDKTKLNKEKPNMVTCSFGINIHTTRCFNWISCGVFDEYIWLRVKGEATWGSRFESYRVGTENDLPGSTGFTKKKFGLFHNKTSNNDERIQDTIYSRITGVFPGDGTQYTSHKCIVQLRQNAPVSPESYEYVVGRADKNGNPDTEHTSDIQEFTLYPTSYTPRIYQITDQQGFTWIEYQVWAAAAEKVLETITEETQASHIIPILINTGDMTQNGTRINEWYDYYEGGRALFNHLEQMNIVGNNDLCGPNPEILGTGDDEGKSNAFYFHVFYCYEIPEIEFEETETTTGAIAVEVLPSKEEAIAGTIYNVNGTYYIAKCNLPIISNTRATKYVPSLYYFENTGTDGVSSYRFVMVNSEITIVTCKEWYKQFDSSGNGVNVYTGWPISNLSTDTYDDSFTTVYTMIYDMIDEKHQNQNVIAVMHEMPFTVVTNANLKPGKENVDRSLNGSNEGALVGSHTNRLGKQDTHAIYWFSRLLEHFNVKMCIGGHKHTYACTNSLREFYFYTDNGVVKNSLEDGKMTMERTLENDTAVWETTLYLDNGRYYLTPITGAETKTINTTKFPLMESEDLGAEFLTDIFYPYYGVSASTNGVTYFMCQATGYKLKSNKELPSNYQMFSYVIPKTNVGTTSDKPSEAQLDPMFSDIILSGNEYTVFLRKIMNIFKVDGSGVHVLFSQLAYSTEPMVYQYLVHEEDFSITDPNIIYGKWITDKQSLITI